MKSSLPERPSLEHLKNQAKQLLSNWKVAEPEALERVRSFRFAHEKPPALSLAQLVVAREYGFPSWTKLKQYVLGLNGTLEDAARKLVQITLMESPGPAMDRTVRHLVALHPGLESFDFGLACTMGNAAYVQEAVGKNPKAASEPTGFAAQPPLAYACFSWFLRNDEARRPGVRKVIALLLSNGADPNATCRWGDYDLPPMYGTAGAAHDVEATKLMLAAGANPSDGESCYHGVEKPGHAILELLFEKGVDEANKTHALFRKLDFDDLETVRWLLDHGCSPNLRWPADQATPLMQALNRDRSLPFLELLLEYGADPALTDDHGQTAYQLAVTLGRHDVVELLARHGVKVELGDYEKWLIEVLQGRRLSGSPDFQRLGRSQRDVACRFASLGKTQELGLLLDAGFPIELGLWATPLHFACWHGKAEAATMLIERGAPLEVVEATHKSTPMGWTLHGSVHCKASPPEDYVRTLSALAESGAALPSPDQDYWQGEGSASPEIQEWLYDRLT